MRNLRLRTALATAFVAWAMPAAHAAATVLAAPSSLEQAVREGRWVFGNDSFGTRRQWIPENAFDGRPMTCAACHGSGMSPSHTPGGFALHSLVGAAARYPQMRGGRLVTLEMQVRNCIARGIGGSVPDDTSPEMLGLLTYLTSLSKGQPIAISLPSP